MRHRKPGIELLAAILFLAGPIACGGESEAPEPPAAPAAPATRAQTPPAPKPPAEASVAEEIPLERVDLPSDVPRYPGAKVSDLGSEDALGLSAGFVTQDDVETVVDYYAAELRKRDWTIQEAPSEGGRAIFADKPGRSLSVVVTPEGAETEIGVLVLDLE